MVEFFGSILLGALAALLIGTVAGALLLETPLLGLFTWPIGAIAFPIYQYRREKRRQRRHLNF